MSIAARKWQVELCDGQESDSRPDNEPIGYSKGIKSEKVTATTIAKAADSMRELKKKRASEIGMAPFKSLLQTAFMMWMSGSSINIFSIMVTGMVVMNTIKSLFDVNNAFDTVNDGVIDLTQPKLIYCLGNCISIALAIYKCGSLGLLPTTSADWTWLLPVKLSTEYSVFAHPCLTHCTVMTPCIKCVICTLHGTFIASSGDIEAKAPFSLVECDVLNCIDRSDWIKDVVRH